MYRVKGADQKEYGPISTEQVRQWIQENRLNRFSLAEKEGEPGWKPLGQFPEFGELLPPQPAGPVPNAPPYSAGSLTGSPVPASREAVLGSVKAPAIALMVVGGLSSLYALTQIAQVLRLSVDQLNEMIAQSGQTLPPGFPLAMVKTVAVIATSLPVLTGLLIVLGGFKFLRLESRGLAMTGAILAMLPCCGTIIPVCIGGLIIGVWAMLVLNKPEVKASFR